MFHRSNYVTLRRVRVFALALLMFLSTLTPLSAARAATGSITLTSATGASGVYSEFSFNLNITEFQGAGEGFLAWHESSGGSINALMGLSFTASTQPEATEAMATAGYPVLRSGSILKMTGEQLVNLSSGSSVTITNKHYVMLWEKYDDGTYRCSLGVRLLDLVSERESRYNINIILGENMSL